MFNATTYRKTTDWRSPANDPTLRVHLHYGLSWLKGNRQAYITVTHHSESRRGRFWFAHSSGACLGTHTVDLFPEFAPLHHLHLVNYPDGEPMHFVSNAKYFRERYIKETFSKYDPTAAVLEKHPDPTVKQINSWIRKEQEQRSVYLLPTDPKLYMDYAKKWRERAPNTQEMMEHKIRNTLRTFDRELIQPLRTEREKTAARLIAENKNPTKRAEEFAGAVRLGLFPDDPAPTIDGLHTLLTAREDELDAWLSRRHAAMAQRVEEVIKQYELKIPTEPGVTDHRTKDDMERMFELSGMGEMCRELGLKLETVPTTRPAVTDWDKAARHYMCTLTRGQNTMKFPFSMGSGLLWSVPGGHTNSESWHRVLRPPLLEDVMECLISDAETAENARSFEDWATDLGYDVDSRKHYDIYQAVVKQKEAFKELLGENVYLEVLGHTNMEGADAGSNNIRT